MIDDTILYYHSSILVTTVVYSFQPCVLFSILNAQVWPILALFCRYWLFCREASIMWWCKIIDKCKMNVLPGSTGEGW